MHGNFNRNDEFESYMCIVCILRVDFIVKIAEPNVKCIYFKSSRTSYGVDDC